MSDPRDPYVIGPPVGGTPAFVGRTQLLAKVRGALGRNQPALVLFGQRRIGKTSLLHELRVGLSEPFLPVYLDLQGLARKSVDAVIEEIATTIARAVNLSPPARGEVRRDNFLNGWLPDQLAVLPEGCVLVLLFDEFDALADPSAGDASLELFPFLRPLLGQHDPRLRLVFTIGRTVDDLQLEARALLREAPTQRVSLLDRSETEALARRSEAPEAGGFPWTAPAIDALWKLTSGHPLLTQALCSALWSRQVYDAERAEPWSVVHLEECLSAALMTAENALVSLWDGLTPACQVVASVLALSDTALRPDELDRALQESGVLTHDPRLRNAPDLLVEWDLLEQDRDSGRWRFKVELLRQWIAARRPPRVVLPVLDRDNAVADLAFRKALQKWRRYAEADTSVQSFIERGVRDDLAEALDNRPSHAGASKLLAEVDAATGHVERALGRLRALHRDQPMVGRSPLIQLLLVLTSRDDDVAEAACKELLRLEPEHPNAQDRLDEIRSQKEEKALEQAVKEAEKLIEAGRFEDASAIIKNYQTKYPESEPLKKVQKTAENRARSRARFLSALEKLRKGEYKQAERFLALLAWEQSYEDQQAVVARLYEAVTQIDPDALIQESAALKATVEEQKGRIMDLERIMELERSTHRLAERRVRDRMRERARGVWHWTFASIRWTFGLPWRMWRSIGGLFRWLKNLNRSTLRVEVRRMRERARSALHSSVAGVQWMFQLLRRRWRLIGSFVMVTLTWIWWQLHMPPLMFPPEQFRNRRVPEKEVLQSLGSGSMHLIRIAGGQRFVGSTPVQVSEFYMGETEVTRAQWDAVMRYNSTEESYYVWPMRSDFPEQGISVESAVNFLNALSRREQRQELYQWDAGENRNSGVWRTIFCGEGFRLPTQAEWGLAAFGEGRKDESRECGDGNGSDKWSVLKSDGYLNFRLCDDPFVWLSPVGSFPPGLNGLYDIVGNVSELTSGSLPPGLNGLYDIVGNISELTSGGLQPNGMTARAVGSVGQDRPGSIRNEMLELNMNGESCGSTWGQVPGWEQQCSEKTLDKTGLRVVLQVAAPCGDTGD